MSVFEDRFRTERHESLHGLAGHPTRCAVYLPAPLQTYRPSSTKRVTGRPCRLGRLADRENRARGRLNTNQLHIRSDRAAQRQDRSPATVGIGEGSAGGPAPARTSSPTFAPGGR